jgi:hypothetical protein
VRREAGGTGDINTTTVIKIFRAMILTWASAHKDRNAQSVDTLREHPGKQPRRGVYLSFLNVCKRALLRTPDSHRAKQSNSLSAPMPSFRPRTLLSYQRAINPSDDPTHNTAIATQSRKQEKPTYGNSPNRPPCPWFKVLDSQTGVADIHAVAMIGELDRLFVRCIYRLTKRAQGGLRRLAIE